MIDEFSDNQTFPRRGMTSIEATMFLRTQFPQVSNWTCWLPEYQHQATLVSLVGNGHRDTGQIGDWQWTRVPVDYPTPCYWYGTVKDLDRKAICWAGVVRIQNSQGEEFLLFSGLDSCGKIGQKYYASTDNLLLLHRFAEDLRNLLQPVVPKTKIRITVYGGESILIDAVAVEQIFLPSRLLEDIEVQATAFYEGAELYRRMQLRHQRGFLFVGPPGNGKTMMVRRLIRACHNRYHASAFTLSIHRKTDEDDIERLFKTAIRATPSLVILEDLDSLTTETQTTRAALLAQLDGLSASDGLLVIGTTNNPHDIDTALLHRPSRFDRVWHFPLPDRDLRRRYLGWAFENRDAAWLDGLAERTEGWTFAFLNELRTTAAILSVNSGSETITNDCILESCKLLSTQVQAIKNNYAKSPTTGVVGFHNGDSAECAA